MVLDFKARFRYGLSESERLEDQSSGFNRWVKLNAENALAIISLIAITPVLAAGILVSPIVWVSAAVTSAYNELKSKPDKKLT